MPSAYLRVDEVATVRGSRLDTVWNQMDDMRKLDAIESASDLVDSIIRQKGGISLQTAKKAVVRVDAPTDTILLPNKPILLIRAISIQNNHAMPFGSMNYSLPVVFGDPNPSNNNIILLADPSDGVGECGFQYQVTAGSLSSYGFRRIPIWSEPWQVFLPDDVVTVTYDCGLASVPAAIKDATRVFLAKSLFAPVDNPEDATSTSSHGSHVDHGRTHLVSPNEINARRQLSKYACNVSG